MCHLDPVHRTLIGAGLGPTLRLLNKFFGAGGRRKETATEEMKLR